MKKIYSDLYHDTIWFCPGMTPDEFKNFSTKKIMECEDCVNDDGATISNDLGIVIWIRHNSALGLPDLVHECIHAANYLLSKRGVTVTSKDDEALAYLVQWIFTVCYKNMRVK